MYGMGRGVPQNDVEGYAWIIVAAENGDEEANHAKAVLQQRMSFSQIATAAEQRAKEIQAELGRKKNANLLLPNKQP